MRLPSAIVGCIACCTAAGLLLADRADAPATRPTTAPATSPASDLTSAEVAALEATLRQLSDRDWRRRQDAQAKLARFGPEYAPLLRRFVNEAAGQEARDRVLEALARIDRLQALRPASVTLRAASISPREALAQLARQAGADIRPGRPSLWEEPPDGKAGGDRPPHLRPIALDLTEQPFWLAVRDVCRKAGLRAESRAGVHGIYVIEKGNPAGGEGGEWLTGPAVASGPCVIVLDRVERVAAIDLPDGAGGKANDDDAPAAERWYRLKLVALCDPRYRLVEGRGIASVVHAVDEHGHSLLPARDPDPPPAPDADPSTDAAGVITAGAGVGAAVTLPPPPPRPDVLRDRGWEWPLHARLDEPAGVKVGRRLARLKGSATFLAVTKSERWEIDPVGTAREVEKEVAGRRYVFKRLGREGARYGVNVTAALSDGSDTAADAARRQQLAGFSLGPRLLDAQGRPWKLVGARVPADSARFMTIVFDSDRDAPDAPGDPAKLVWDLPAEIAPVTVPFEFRDVPLP